MTTPATQDSGTAMRESNAVVAVAVTGLFGKYDYTLSLGTDQRCLILYGPNGAGKTVILRMLHALFAPESHMEVFGSYPFRSFTVTLADHSIVDITSAGSRIELSLTQPGAERLVTSATLIHFRSPILYPTPDWLKLVRDSTRVWLIETDRVILFEDRRKPDPVHQSAEDLASQLKAAATEYAAHAQALDRTFPRRFIEGAYTVASRADLPARLEAVFAGFDRMQRIGLLASSDTPVVSTLPADLPDHMLGFLSLYADDAREKLDPINDFAERVEMFAQQIHSWLDDKIITITPEQGFFIDDKQTRARIPFAGLSSGERHLLVMWHELLFMTPRGALVLIDEPEISWHVSWQKRFLDDLLRVSEVVGFTTVIATHSPFIPGPHLDLTFALGRAE